MNKLKTHVENGEWRELYQSDEVTHALRITYNLILWLIRDEADSLSFLEDNIIWFKDGIKVGEFPAKPQPTPTFVELIDLVIERDNMVRNYMQRSDQESDSYILKAE